MDASPVAGEPAGEHRPYSVRRDVQLAGLVLAVCAWDVFGSFFMEPGFEAGPIDWPARLWQNFQSSLLMIAPGVLAVRLTLPSGYPTSLRRCLQLIAVYLVGAAIGHWFAFRSFQTMPSGNPPNIWPVAAFSLAYAALFATFFVGAMYWWRRGLSIQQDLHRTRIDLLAMKADHADAELLRLRTQIEPHFLFNTIANIVQMYQTDPAAAGRTLARLIDYMDASHAHMRRQEARLDEELVLTEGYLEIQRLRMGARLRYEIDVSPDLRRTPIPPAALLTLVENAIKHGLAPQIGGGTVRVSARREGASLVLSVADNGIGLRATSGRGLGLANVRARVQGLYGSAASLRLTSGTDGGAMATLRLPFGSLSAGTLS